jgi:uridylate kinase
MSALYRRVVLKLSGEVIPDLKACSFPLLMRICSDIKALCSAGVSVSIVIGGGNIIRGRDFGKGVVDKRTSDSAGMLSSAINGLILKDFLAKAGVKSVILSTLDLPFGIKKLDFNSIEQSFERGLAAILVGGLGLPGFSTDTFSVVASIISKSELILKATKTDGVYSSNPSIDKNAEFLPIISHQEFLDRKLQIIDQSAVLLARDNSISIYVFSMNEENCFLNALDGKMKLSTIAS